MKAEKFIKQAEIKAKQAEYWMQVCHAAMELFPAMFPLGLPPAGARAQICSLLAGHRWIKDEVVFDMCDNQHKFAALPDHPTRDGVKRCPHCLATGLDYRQDHLLRIVQQGFLWCKRWCIETTLSIQAERELKAIFVEYGELESIKSAPPSESPQPKDDA